MSHDWRENVIFPMQLRSQTPGAEWKLPNSPKVKIMLLEKLCCFIFTTVRVSIMIICHKWCNRFETLMGANCSHNEYHESSNWFLLHCNTPLQNSHYIGTFSPKKSLYTCSQTWRHAAIFCFRNSHCHCKESISKTCKNRWHTLQTIRRLS